ncbi:membrane protein [Streptomyces xiamenensis]|uniref:Membrane protein n=1 Tax=Streptomyces xiamenensis TaxID=408015 RepID=A0A0F7FT86_9ACTN|nr:MULTISPECIES: hypothetical protein [Streptomyces]AKG43248.1 membrane protein [Streptomyces xiamenensis]
MTDPELAHDLDAAVQTRKELGATYESELIESFLEKVEQRIDTAVDKRVRRQVAEQQMVVARGGRPEGIRRPGSALEGPGGAFALAVVSLVLAVPLSAIAAANLGLAGLVVCWGGIVGINACFTIGGSLRRPDNGDG